MREEILFEYLSQQFYGNFRRLPKNLKTESWNDAKIFRLNAAVGKTHYWVNIALLVFTGGNTIIRTKKSVQLDVLVIPIQTLWEIKRKLRLILHPSSDSTRAVIGQVQKKPAYKNTHFRGSGGLGSYISGILGEISLKVFLIVLNFLLLKMVRDLLTIM